MADTCNAHVATFFILTFKVFSYLKIVFAIFFYCLIIVLSLYVSHNGSVLFYCMVQL